MKCGVEYIPKKLLAGFGMQSITKMAIVYSDNNFAYHDIISHKILKIGKNNTQKIERKHLTFRTRLKRLARKTICYSKSLEMHKILISLLINLLEFSSKLL